MNTAARFVDRLAEIRHADLFEQGDAFPKAPSGFRADDVIGEDSLEGFVPIEQAAERMGLEEDEVIALAQSGRILTRRSSGTVVVRPAIHD